MTHSFVGEARAACHSMGCGLVVRCYVEGKYAKAFLLLEEVLQEELLVTVSRGNWGPDSFRGMEGIQEPVCSGRCPVPLKC